MTTFTLPNQAELQPPSKPTPKPRTRSFGPRRGPFALLRLSAGPFAVELRKKQTCRESTGPWELTIFSPAQVLHYAGLALALAHGPVRAVFDLRGPGGNISSKPGCLVFGAMELLCHSLCLNLFRGPFRGEAREITRKGCFCRNHFATQFKRGLPSCLNIPSHVRRPGVGTLDICDWA